MKCFFQLSSLCREIAWDAIALGGTKHFPGGVHYPGAIFLVAIIWGYISVVNVILQGNSLRASCPRANYIGDNFRAFVRRVILQGAIVLFPFEDTFFTEHLLSLVSFLIYSDFRSSHSQMLFKIVAP